MNLKIHNAPGNAVIVEFPVDHLDAGNVKEFREAIAAVAAANTAVVIDMGPLRFVDSSGLGALLSVLRTMNGKNGQLRLFGMAKPVKALFELVRMHRIFQIYGTREEALEDVDASGGEPGAAPAVR